MFNEKDLILLRHLRSNSRKSLAKISRETNIPTSTLFDRLTKLERDIVKKHTSLIDFSKVGYSSFVTFFIKSNNKEKLKSFLSSNKSVNSLCRISPGFDFYVECVFKDLRDVDEFMEELNVLKITKLKQSFIVDEL